MCTHSLSSTRALLRCTWLFYERLAHTGTERLSHLIQQAEPSKVPLGTSATTSTIKIREVTIFFLAFGWTPLPSNPWCRIHIPHPPCRNHRFCLCFQLHKKFSLNLYFCIFFRCIKKFMFRISFQLHLFFRPNFSFKSRFRLHQNSNFPAWLLLDGHQSRQGHHCIRCSSCHASGFPNLACGMMRTADEFETTSLRVLPCHYM